MPSPPAPSPLSEDPADPFLVTPPFPDPVLLTFSSPPPPPSAASALAAQPLVVVPPLSEAIAPVSQPFAAALSTRLPASFESQSSAVASATPPVPSSLPAPPPPCHDHAINPQVNKEIESRQVQGTRRQRRRRGKHCAPPLSHYLSAHSHSLVRHLLAGSTTQYLCISNGIVRLVYDPGGNSVSSNGDNSDASHSTPSSVNRSVCYNPISVLSVVQPGRKRKGRLSKHDNFSDDDDFAPAMLTNRLDAVRRSTSLPARRASSFSRAALVLAFSDTPEETLPTMLMSTPTPLHPNFTQSQWHSASQHSERSSITPLPSMSHGYPMLRKRAQIVKRVCFSVRSNR